MALIKSLLQLLVIAATWLQQRQLITTAEGNALGAVAQEGLDIVEKSRAVGDHVRRNPDSDYSRDLRKRHTRPE